MARSVHFDSSTISLLASSPSQMLRNRDSEWGDNPYPVGSTSSRTPSLSGKFSLSADPSTWGSNLSPNVEEPDDALHLPTVRGGKMVEDADLSFSRRGIANVGCLTILCTGILMLFIGYPIMTYVQDLNTTTTSSNLGVNASGQVRRRQFMLAAF